ncbi:AMP-binding protein, partial [Saccharothrix longispora]|uniref:AMP-binding protein n=1 Tax=Saccharothrix longispora TaxID=33920 RepID=UPI0028FD61B8
MSDDAVYTAIPRWAAPGAPAGTGRHETRLPARVRAAAEALGVPFGTVLRAAHLRVLSALTSERSVSTTLVSPDGRATTGIDVPDGSWRDLVAVADRTPAVPGERTGDAALCPSGEPSEVDPEQVLLVWSAVDGDDLVLGVRYRTDALDADQVARIAGYHAAALTAIAEDPDAPHTTRSLLSDEEVEYQLHGLAGERAPLPEDHFLRLVAEQVALRPNETAVAHDGQRLTYRELADRANGVAADLLAAGLRPEDVVAVVADRTLDWAVATLGVFLAGGVYLPIRPDFPAGRVRTQLLRSRCRAVLHEPGSAALVEAATEGVETIGHVRVIADIPASDNPVDVAIGPDQLAYIYFTSGSTGEPKGAMCEHAGMLNHLLMKIEDFGIGAGDVVAQTASQCFDISLWQLVAPWLVGGSALLVDTDVQLDVPRFLDELDAAGVAVVQLVPSYFEVLLDHVEKRPRPLGSVRVVSVTGEALKLGPVHRWFARFPD